MSNKLVDLGNKIWKFGHDNKPEVLSGLAIAGLWGTIYGAYKTAPIARDILERGRSDMRLVHPDDKSARRAVVKETAIGVSKYVLPVIVGGAVTTACIIGSNRESSKRIATLSAAYALSDSALKELNAKLGEVLGEQKKQKVKNAIAKDHLNKREPVLDNPSNPVIVTGDGDVLCIDSYSGRPFYSNAQKIGQAINILSADCQCDMYVSLNDFYDEIHLDRIPMGDDFGWNVEDLERGQLPITISAQLTASNVPCLCIEYDVSLRQDYRNLH